MPKRAFTLIELLVVIAIIGILAAMLMPVLSRAKQRAQGTLCLDNGKQLMTAIHLYIAENNDFYPPNPDDGNTVPDHNWCSGQAGIGGPQEFNPDVLLDPNLSLLINYLSRITSVFHCPGDKRQGVYQGTNPQFLGKIIPAARTFSMSQAVGTICQGFDQGNGHSGPPKLSVNGPWLDNTDGHRRNSPWRTFGKMSDAGPPSPSDLWVLVDEDPNGLNDAAFAVTMVGAEWHDLPGTYHNIGCGFAFADGHSETHRWLYRSVKEQGNVADSNDDADWRWVTAHTSARAD